MKKTNKAFTLIELLVVVLIIGILASIAVPQYKAAVDKTRLSRILPVIKDIHMAQQVYQLSTGHYAEDFSQLDILLPAGANSTSANEVIYDDVRYYIYKGNETSQSIMCYDRQKRLPDMEQFYTWEYMLCWHYGDEYKKKLCQNFPNTSCPTDKKYCQIY